MTASCSRKVEFVARDQSVVRQHEWLELGQVQFKPPGRKHGSCARLRKMCHGGQRARIDLTFNPAHLDDLIREADDRPCVECNAAKECRLPSVFDEDPFHVDVPIRAFPLDTQECRTTWALNGLRVETKSSTRAHSHPIHPYLRIHGLIDAHLASANREDPMTRSKRHCRDQHGGRTHAT